jgi:hypothetical protein
MNPLGSIARNLLVIVSALILSLAAISILQRFVAADSLLPSGGALAIHVASLIVAMRLSARGAAYLIGAVSAFEASELLIQLVYGVGRIQSAPVHYAVWLAAAFGLLVGVLVKRPTSDVLLTT